MEYLAFSPLDQWTLQKTSGSSPLTSPKDADTPGNKPYKAYTARALAGQLPEDNGQKGALHVGGGKRPRPTWSPQRVGKTPHLMDSAFNARYPGVGD